MRIPYLTAAAAMLAAAAPVSAVHAQPDHDAARGRQAALDPEVARWGGVVDGRWEGGHRAPGGWAAYRTPVVGEAVPRYWIAPGFYIADGARYGLPTARLGDGWYRYYDIAVLLDREGRVQDYRRGIDWSGRTPRSYRTNAVVPRPARVAAARHDAPVVASFVPHAPVVVTRGGSHTTTTTTHGPAGGYIANGYYYPPQTVTTITIHPPVTTTMEEVVTYTTEDVAQ